MCGFSTCFRDPSISILIPAVSHTELHPTLGTMILGLIAGRWLRTAAPKDPDEAVRPRGVIGVASSLVIHYWEFVRS